MSGLIIDCELHPEPEGPKALRRYMNEPFRSRYSKRHYGFYANPVEEVHSAWAMEKGKDPGTAPERVRKLHIEPHGIRHAVLVPRSYAGTMANVDYAAAVASAFNDWQREVWLTDGNADGVFKGTISIAQQDPVHAAREIERCAEWPHIVQVQIDSGAQAPLGHKDFHPIYERCARYGLPLAIHPGTEGMGVNEQPSAGYPSTYFEWHAGWSLSVQGHLISLITEGVFDLFPDLRVVLYECGAAWLRPLLWRLDDEADYFAAEAPGMKRKPSEYAEQIYVATHRLEKGAGFRGDAASGRAGLWDDTRLLYASNFAKFDYQSPEAAQTLIGNAGWRLAAGENAKRLYGRL